MKKGKGIARWAAALLCLAMVFSLFVGCHAGNGREEGAGADRTEAGQEQAENRGTKGAALSFVEKDTEERYTSEKILVDGIIRYFAMSRDRTGYRLYAADGAGGWRIYLDGDFREVSREKLDETETVNLYDAGAGEPPYELQLDFDVLGDPDRLIARDGERLFTLPVSAGDEYSVRVFPEEEGLYVLNYDYLVLDGKELRLPEAGGFGRVTVRGMLRLDGRKWVLLENEETHTRHIAEVTGQTVGEAAKTDLTGSSFTPDGRGGTLFVREDELWQTRGNEIVRLFNLRKMGLLALDCCDLWMEEDRIVIMEEDGIFVIRETEEEAKEEAVIGCVYGVDAFLGNVISAYNLSGEGIVTTHVYNSEEKLNLALLSGEVDLAVSSSPELQRDRARSGAL
ncbi:MAG: hypothetical protein J5849_06555, partial [Clostridia bacterium]|nr:hypothetical protein [Clostridia bacterium]